MAVVSKPYYHQQMYNQPPMQYGYRPMSVNNTIPPRSPIVPPQPQMGYTSAPPPQQPIARPPVANAGRVVPSSNRSPIRKVYLQKTTKNKSFLDMHHYLKSIGIKNNAFMLTLIDPDLEGIDPYDPHLNAYYKQKVLRECICNYWYFIREIVKLPSSGAAPMRYKLTRGNLALSFCQCLNINVFLELPRLTFKSSISVMV